MALPLAFDKVSRGKKRKDCGNSSTSPCKNTLFQKPSTRNQNPSRYYLCPDLRCWFTNHRWYQLRGQRSVDTLAGNQLLPKRGRKALIDMVDQDIIITL
jgi:hypothetical protein